MSDRAVSDVVAFILTFSIIITGVGIVSTGGFDRLTVFTSEQQIDNGERGMEAAAAAVDNIHLSNDTYREFDLSLNGGNVFLNSSSIVLETNSSEPPDLSEVGGSPDRREIELNALEHRFDRGEEVVSVVYEGGAVFRTDTARPRYEPGITVDGETAIVSLVNLTTDDSIDRSGGYRPDVTLEPTAVPQESPVSADRQFISFSAEFVGQQRVYETGAQSLAIDVSKTTYPQQWAYFFEEIDAGSYDETTETYRFPSAVDSVVVRVATIELSSLERKTL